MSADAERVRADETDGGDGEARSAAGEGTTDAVDLDRYQWAVVVAGTVLAVGGVAATLLTPLAPSSSLLLLVGMAGLLGAVWRGYTYLVTELSVRALPRVGRRAGVRRTGGEVDEAVRDAEGGGERDPDSAWVTIRHRLEPLAARLLAEREGTSEREATEALRVGSWTDDATARRLFQQDGGSSYLVAFLRRTPSVSRQVQAVFDRLGGDRLDAAVPSALGPTDDATSTGEREWPTGTDRTGHWRGVSAAGLAALSVAVLVGQPALVLVAAVLLGVAGYARLGTAPVADLTVERSLSDTDPHPGDHVTVTVTVENAGDALLPDLRLVDAVPDDLRVVNGSPGHATALRPGERTRFAYDVLAVYGEHDFDRLYTVTHDASGHHERTSRTDDGGVTLTCEPRAVEKSVPLHPQTSGVVGRVPTDVGGSGHEFHSVREYRPGDPLRRVDWNRVARTGDLATLQFREEHAATVVVLVDTRSEAFQAPTPDALSAVDRSLAGTMQVVESLLADGDRVGLASVGLDWTWIPPGAGGDHRERIRETLQSDPNFDGSHHAVRFNVDRYVRRLRRRLPSDAQLLYFSPLLDDASADVARRLHAHGHSVTAFSPDPTTTDSLGSAIVRIERTLAVDRLRESEVPVVDWGHGEPLALAVERARQGWDR